MKSILELNSREVINVTSLEDAIKLTTKFNELGLKWCNGNSYLHKNEWDKYCSNTCYVPASGEFSPKDYYEKLNYKVYKMEDLKEFQSSNNYTVKTTKEKLFQIFNVDPCKEFNTVLEAILKEHYNVPDTAEIIILDKYTSRVQKECSDKQKQLLKEIGIEIKFPTSNWSREKCVNTYEYFFLTRGANDTFKVATGGDDRRKAYQCYKTQEIAQQELKIFNVMSAMRNWARYHNQIDKFTPDWTKSNQEKYGLFIHSQNQLTISSRYGDNELLFCIALKSYARAEEMRKEFEHDLKQIMPFL